MSGSIEGDGTVPAVPHQRPGQTEDVWYSLVLRSPMTDEHGGVGSGARLGQPVNPRYDFSVDRQIDAPLNDALLAYLVQNLHFATCPWVSVYGTSGPPESIDAAGGRLQTDS